MLKLQEHIFNVSITFLIFLNIKYGDKCQFAHGMVDLKDVNRHPKYKTDFCKTFHSKGFCPYGPRCHFIHDLNEKFEQIPNSTGPNPKFLTSQGVNSDSQASWVRLKTFYLPFFRMIRSIKISQYK
jgi:hypothetical protein